MKLYLATTNLHKIEELNEMLREAKIDAEVHVLVAGSGSENVVKELALASERRKKILRL